MLKIRRLGSQGLEVSEIGLGCMGMTYAYGQRDDAESVSTVHRALELGVTLFDTAEVYGPYSNEMLLSEALKGRRDRAVIATKFGFDIQDERVVGLDSRPEHIRRAVDASLARLGTDYIDLLYQHRVDPKVPIEDVAGTVGDLVRLGKVRFFGLSVAGPATIRRAHAVHPVSAVHQEYSLWERSAEEALYPVLEELDIGLVAYSPLGRGFLTGSALRAEAYPKGDYRRHDPRYQGENFDANMRIVNAVTDIAGRLGIRPGQAALAWLLGNNSRIVPIPGTKRRGFLEENIGAAAITLGVDIRHELNNVLSPNTVSGQRYEERIMGLIDNL